MSKTIRNSKYVRGTQTTLVHVKIYTITGKGMIRNFCEWFAIFANCEQFLEIANNFFVILQIFRCASRSKKYFGQYLF